MPNYVSTSGSWYNLSDSPTSAATELVNIQAIVGFPTMAQIQTQVTITDSTVVVVANEYELGGVNA